MKADTNKLNKHFNNTAARLVSRRSMSKKAYSIYLMIKKMRFNYNQVHVKMLTSV